jgi:hypothetical protein
MINSAKKMFYPAALAAGVLLSSNAMAFEDFQVTEGSVPGAAVNTYTADRFVGGYQEIVTFGAGTFDVSILWTAGQFFDDGAGVASQVGGFGASSYDMYGLFQASGTFVPNGAGGSLFTFNSGGTLNLLIDADKDNAYAAPLTGDLAWTATGNTADDILIATGEVLSGAGVLDPTLSTCGPGVNCGSFGTNTDFNLTAAGKNFFTAPIPFYNVSFQSGQFDNFNVVGTQSIVGSLDAVFNVPEPSVLALFGLGLLGMGGVARRKTKAKA